MIGRLASEAGLIWSGGDGSMEGERGHLEGQLPADEYAFVSEGSPAPKYSSLSKGGGQGQSMARQAVASRRAQERELDLMGSRLEDLSIALISLQESSVAAERFVYSRLSLNIPLTLPFHTTFVYSL